MIKLFFSLGTSLFHSQILSTVYMLHIHRTYMPIFLLCFLLYQNIFLLIKELNLLIPGQHLEKQTTLLPAECQ